MRVAALRTLAALRAGARGYANPTFTGTVYKEGEKAVEVRCRR